MAINANAIFCGIGKETIPIKPVPGTGIKDITLANKIKDHIFSDELFGEVENKFKDYTQQDDDNEIHYLDDDENPLFKS